MKTATRDFLAATSAFGIGQSHMFWVSGEGLGSWDSAFGFEFRASVFVFGLQGVWFRISGSETSEHHRPGSEQVSNSGLGVQHFPFETMSALSLCDNDSTLSL